MTQVTVIAAGCTFHNESVSSTTAKEAEIEDWKYIHKLTHKKEAIIGDVQEITEGWKTPLTDGKLFKVLILHNWHTVVVSIVC